MTTSLHCFLLTLSHFECVFNKAPASRVCFLPVRPGKALVSDGNTECRGNEGEKIVSAIYFKIQKLSLGIFRELELLEIFSGTTPELEKCLPVTVKISQFLIENP